MANPVLVEVLRGVVVESHHRGAVAVVFATGPLQDEGKDRVPPLANDGPESPAGIPVLQVKTSLAQKWVGDPSPRSGQNVGRVLNPSAAEDGRSAASDGLRTRPTSLAAFQKDVDKDLKPRSRVLAMTLSGTTDVMATNAQGENIAGVLPGKGALENEIVVLGAHYDHLGYGGEGSMKPNVNAIHPGADDNASGVAGVLAAAAIIRDALKDVPNHRTVAFMLFSGEERGLAGSGYLVQHPPFAIDRVVGMVNLDMVGALRDDKVTAFGTDSAPEWRALIDSAAAGSNLKLTETGDGYGPSDQTSFYAVKIPVLHFFTGAHERYHTPEDVADAVNFAGEERVVDVIAKIVAGVARGDATPHYARAQSAPAMQGDSRGYGAYLGTVPDYSAMDATTGGVLLSDVRPGSPAEKAGIKGGDRIVDIGGTRIENLYDMTYALQDHKPGDTVDVTVIRKDTRTPLRATLSTRGTPAPPAPKKLVINAGKPYASTAGEKHLADVRQPFCSPGFIYGCSCMSFASR